MSELDKNKSGLQKKGSSAFKGVPAPQNNGSQQPSDSRTPDAGHAIPPKSGTAKPQVSPNSLIKKLNQPEDSREQAAQKQTPKAFSKPTSPNPRPKNPPITKLPQPEESFKQAAKAASPQSPPIIEETGDGLWQQIKDRLFTPKPGTSPARQKAMVIMIPILAIIMIFAFRQVLSKSPRKTKGAENEDTPAVVSNAGSGHEIDWEIPEPITAMSRDPIKLPEQTDPENPEQNTEENETEDKPGQRVITIRDIVYSHDRPSAVIGTKIVYVGDKVNDATILKINRDSIEFEMNGKKWEQNVREGKKIPISEVPDESENQPEE